MNILQKFSIPRASGTADRARIICLLAALFAISFLLAISVGGSEASVIDAISSALRGDNAELSFRIIFFIRLPRAVGAALAGAALSVSGIIIQAVLNNPMAAPNVIGV
ncbi:MAG: iron chelate uptake ABC transporter family permease subunit, partial [Clostridia bacterium]|nr:iron chelate uptake ABC transporter family permease subunit [Clostridia bacterium]